MFNCPLRRGFYGPTSIQLLVFDDSITAWVIRAAHIVDSWRGRRALGMA